jgi:hypothetical protein
VTNAGFADFGHAFARQAFGDFILTASPPSDGSAKIAL